MTSAPPQIVGRYELGKVLASGDFDCRTRLCTHTVTGAHYAVRIYDKRILSEASWMWNQTREAVQVMRTLPKNEHIVEMVECFETETSLYILMQLFSPTSVTKIYTTQRDVPLSKTRHYFAQVVRGVLHMHDHNVVHCGLAPDHVLVNDRDQVKIGFLVSCRFYQKGKPMTEMRGTKHTVAPEVLRQEPYHPTLADAWSLGVLLFFMLNGGQYPHDGANTSKNILNHKIRPLNPALPEQARDLVNRLLTYDPAVRMSAHQILHHPWMLEDRDEEEELQGLRRMASSSHRGSLTVEASYDAQSDVLNIVLPTGLSVEEEAAYIIQHTWRAYCKRKTASLGRSGTRASLKLKRITSSLRASGAFEGRRRSRDEGGAADSRKLGRSGSISGELTMSVPAAAAADQSTAAADTTTADTLHPHQCPHCKRMPPQRIFPGKPPYPNTKFKLTKDGVFEEVATPSD